MVSADLQMATPLVAPLTPHLIPCGTFTSGEAISAPHPSTDRTQDVAMTDAASVTSEPAPSTSRNIYANAIAALTAKEERLRVATEFRKQCPWIKSATLEAILDAHAEDLHKQIVEAEEEEEDRKGFFSLPDEVRNTIYELVLTQDSPVLIWGGKKSHSTAAGCYFPRQYDSRKSATPDAKALLQVCRQVRAEASPVYYASNIFETQYPTSALSWSATIDRTLTEWLQTIGPIRAKHIKELRLVHCQPEGFIYHFNSQVTVPITKSGLHYHLGLSKLGVSEDQFVAEYRSEMDGEWNNWAFTYREANKE